MSSPASAGTIDSAIFSPFRPVTGLLQVVVGHSLDVGAEGGEAILAAAMEDPHRLDQEELGPHLSAGTFAQSARRGVVGQFHPVDPGSPAPR